jgi:hypothetical protein
MTKLKNIKIEIINKVENNQQSKNKYKTPQPEREIEENYESIESNQKEPYSTPIYELMRPNINTMRNYTLDNTERDKIIGEEYINTMTKPSTGITDPSTIPEPEAVSKPFDMNEFKREYKKFKNDLFFKLKQIDYKFGNFRKLPNVLEPFREYILDIYKNNQDPGVLDLAITSYADELKSQYPDKFN